MHGETRFEREERDQRRLANAPQGCTHAAAQPPLLQMRPRHADPQSLAVAHFGGMAGWARTRQETRLQRH